MSTVDARARLAPAMLAARAASHRALIALRPRIDALAVQVAAAREGAARTIAAGAPGWVRTIHRAIASAALGSFQRGRGVLAKVFLNDWLRLREAADALEALWIVLRQPAWRRAREPLVYLGIATRREAERILRDREVKDRLWDLGEPVEMDFKQVAAAGADADASADLLNVLADLERTGTPRDRRLIALVRGGMTPAEAIHQTGGGWSGWQTLQRKAVSRIRKA